MASQELEAKVLDINVQNIRIRLSTAGGILIYPKYRSNIIAYDFTSNAPTAITISHISPRFANIQDKLNEIFGKGFTLESYGHSYLRIRNDMGRTEIILKIPSGASNGIKIETEFAAEVTNSEERERLDKALVSSGMSHAFIQQKDREIWQVKDALVFIDEWPNIPPYLEIEADTSERINQVATVLGIPLHKLTSLSGRELFMRFGLNPKRLVFS